MRKSALIWLAGCLLAISSGAQAQDAAAPDAAPDADRVADVKASLLDTIPGFYISPLLSGALLTGEAELNGDSVDFDGYYLRGGLALGYQYESIRLEIEPSVGYAETESDLPDMLAPFVEDDEEIVFVTLTGSVYYDFPPIIERQSFGQPFNVRPYLGTGAGVLYAEFDELDDDATGMIGQGMAGIGLRLTARTHLDIGYRLVYLPRLKPGDTDIEATFHTGEIKLRYRF